jgi:hypothetical protein
MIGGRVQAVLGAARQSKCFLDQQDSMIRQKGKCAVHFDPVSFDLFLAGSLIKPYRLYAIPVAGDITRFEKISACLSNSNVRVIDTS